MNKRFKQIACLSLVGMTLVGGVGVANANEVQPKSTDVQVQEVSTETEISKEEWDAIGSDSTYAIKMTDEIREKIMNGEDIQVQNANDPTQYATVNFGWNIGSSNWSIKYTGLDSKVYSSHVKVTTKFYRSGWYTGTLHNSSHYGYTNYVSASGKVGQTYQKTIQNGDWIYLTVTQSGKTLYNSGLSA